MERGASSIHLRTADGLEHGRPAKKVSNTWEHGRFRMILPLVCYRSEKTKEPTLEVGLGLEILLKLFNHQR